MSLGISSTVYALSGAACATLLLLWQSRRIPWPKIKFTGHTERHNGIRITDIGVTLWLPKRSERTASAARQMVECAFYVTLRK